MILFGICAFLAFLLLCFERGYKAGAKSARHEDLPSWDGHSGHARKGSVGDWGP